MSSNSPASGLPAPLRTFLDRMVALVVAGAGDDVVGTYLVGSFAQNDAGEDSDIDLLVVVADDATANLAQLGEDIADLAAEAPARGVECVIYRHRELARPTHPLQYAVNINAGSGMARSVTTSGDRSFWFLLDVAMARVHAVPLLGPPLSGIAGEPRARDVIAALRESIHWHRDHGNAHPNTVLNGCRAWCWVVTGEWVSKTAAGQWARSQGAPSVVEQALAARRRGSMAALSSAEVEPFLRRVAQRLTARADGGADL